MFARVFADPQIAGADAIALDRDNLTDQLSVNPNLGVAPDDDGAELRLPKGLLLNKEAAEHYADMMMERASGRSRP